MSDKGLSLACSVAGVGVALILATCAAAGQPLSPGMAGAVAVLILAYEAKSIFAEARYNVASRQIRRPAP